MKKTWQKAEKQDSKLFKTKQQKASGSLDHYPTDSFSDTYAIDTKHTTRDSYSVSVTDWIKLCNETAQLDAKDNKLRTPILSLHFQKWGLHLVVLGFEDFKRLDEQL